MQARQVLDTSLNSKALANTFVSAAKRCKTLEHARHPACVLAVQLCGQRFVHLCHFARAACHALIRHSTSAALANAP